MDMDMSSTTYPHHWLSFSLSNNYHHGLLEAFSDSSAPQLGTPFISSSTNNKLGMQANRYNLVCR
jgi:hypothetical protein